VPIAHVVTGDGDESAAPEGGGGFADYALVSLYCLRVYLDASDRMTIDLLKEMPQITGEISRAEADLPSPSMLCKAFGRIDVTGRLSAEDIGAEGVPVVVRLGNVRLGRTRTGSDGTYAFTGRVPASVDDGERALTATVPLEERALAGVDRSRSVTVDPTATTLAVSGEQVSGETVRVSGTLESTGTTGTTGVPDQPVELVIDGRSVAIARTNADGDSTERVELPADIASEQGNVSVTLAARYERPDSNLLASRARTTLRRGGRWQG